MRASQALESEAEEFQAPHAEIELGEFSYAVAHDLSTELRHVGEFAKLLMRDAAAENPATARNAQIVAAAAQRCQSQLEAIGLYSVIQRRPLALKLCDAGALVERALREAEQEPGAHPAHVGVDVTGKVYGDEFLLGGAMRLAIANALQFPRPEADLKIAISGGARSDGGWRLLIRDNGQGLAPQYREKAFRLFWRLDPQRPHAGPGSGLTIVRRIMRRHGGDARFLDCEDGACLELCLPPGSGR